MKSSFQNYFRFLENLKYLIIVLLFTIFNSSLAQTCYPYFSIYNINVTQGQTVSYNAQQYIDSGNSIIYNNGKARFQAENKITLKPGFRVFAGGEFKGGIQTCSTILPNDPLFAMQWGHRNTGNIIPFGGGAPIGQIGMDSKILDAWNITKGSPTVIVAIIDSGLDIGHPDIDPSRIYRPYNFSTNSTNVNDPLGHGTMVTGVIAATVNNGIGLAGIDQFCKVMPLQFDFYNPNEIQKQLQIARAIRYASDNGAKIINLSFGAPDESIQEIKNAIDYAISRGATIFAAAGNVDSDGVDFPSRYSQVISVGASTPCGLRKVALNLGNVGTCDKDYRKDRDQNNGWGSSYGNGLDILAPGVLLFTTDVRGDNGYSNPIYNGFFLSTPDGNYIKDAFGTSFSSPFAAGVASLMLSINPNLSSQNIDYILKTSATNLVDGNKMINARAALEMSGTFIGNYSASKSSLASSFEIYPNPAQNNTAIDFKALNVERIIITNILGEKKFEQKIEDIGKKQLEINTSLLQNGIYVISIIDVYGIIHSKKLIKN